MEFTRDGLVFEVSDDGPAGAAPVLLLHGFPQRSLMWDLVTPALRAAGRRVLALDQRGYSPGATPADPAAYRMRHCVADVVGLLDALGLDRVDLVGHDWGALVGWQVAVRQPDRVRTLTAASVPHPVPFVAAMTSDPDQRERSSYIDLFRQAGRAEQVLLADAGTRLRAMFAGCPPPRIDRYADPLVAAPAALTGALNWYRAMSADDLADLGPCPVPATLVWGERDPAIGPRAVLDCARYVTGPYELVRLPSAGHWLADEVPDALAAAILARAGAAA